MPISTNTATERPTGEALGRWYDRHRPAAWACPSPIGHDHPVRGPIRGAGPRAFAILAMALGSSACSQPEADGPDASAPRDGGGFDARSGDGAAADVVGASDAPADA